jgi:hypothetical protein
MRDLLRDAGHLFRLAGIFLVLLVVFLVARAVFIPKGFGMYGHYRGPALEEIRQRPIAFAGRAACLDCHDEINSVKKNGKHAGLGCEACHGPLQAHVDDPSTVVPDKPNAKTLCLVCHSENLAKPRDFPQINPKEHADDEHCTKCHNPHAPLPVKE